MGFSNEVHDPATASPFEVWFPINGYVSFIEPGSSTGHIVDQLLMLGSNNFRSNEKLDMRVNAGKESPTLYFYCEVGIDKAERMKEIAERSGVVELSVNFYHSLLDNVGTIGQKTYDVHSIFSFQISKTKIHEWVKKWSQFYAYVEDLPKNTPKEVVDDYHESFLCLNVNAFKASVAMSRRALQQALEAKGATKHTTLYDQVEELKQKGVLDAADANLAHGIRQFGNFGTHPQDDLLSQVGHDQAKIALEVVKLIIKKIFS